MSNEYDCNVRKDLKRLSFLHFILRWFYNKILKSTIKFISPWTQKRCSVFNYRGGVCMVETIVTRDFFFFKFWIQLRI